MAANPRPQETWDPAALALPGAILGTLLVVGYETYRGLTGVFYDVDPFVHIMTEFAVFSGGGGAVFAAIAWIHNRRQH
jgi:hypothetical protein